MSRGDGSQLFSAFVFVSAAKSFFLGGGETDISQLVSLVPIDGQVENRFNYSHWRGLVG